MREHGEHQHDARSDAEHRLGQQQRRHEPAVPREVEHDAQRAEEAAAAVWGRVLRRARGPAGNWRGCRRSTGPRSRSVAALSTNAMSRPNVAAISPPIAAPTASITPQAEPISTFASPSSSSSTRLGSAADEVGSKNAAPTDSSSDSEQRDPERARVAREQERQRHRHAREVGDDEQLPSIEPIGEDAGDRRREREAARLEDEHERRGRGRAGRLERQPEQGDRGEPVAGEADQLRRIHPSKRTDCGAAARRRAQGARSCRAHVHHGPGQVIGVPGLRPFGRIPTCQVGRPRPGPRRLRQRHPRSGSG